jgi:hypothetical protein
MEGRSSMKRHILMLTTCTFVLACGAAGAAAEESLSFHGHEGHGMMGQGVGCGVMGRGDMVGSRGMMGRGAAMRFIFALMDSDGDGTVSLQEFQAAHEKIFKAMDTDKDGTLTLGEIQAFMRGTGKSAHQHDEHEHE